MKKFKIITLGCRTNQYESAAYADQLKKMGYSPAKPEESAEICIVNTCTVTHSADARSKTKLRHILQENADAQVFVTGCMVEQAPNELLSLGKEKLTLVPNKNKEELLRFIFPEEENLPEFSICQFEAHTRAFIKVQDGCNSFCTYCIIPYVRGRSRSRPIEDVLKEVKEVIASGYQEIVLTGINIGDYQDGAKKLADLVREVDKVPGLQRLRISSIDADEIQEDLMAAVLEGKTTCPSMHIVLQSGSNAILKRMNRKYTRQIFQEIFQKLQKNRPDFTATTDVIVGFPGETEEDFEQTLEVLEQVQFAKVHCFPYSPRPRTRAALYPDQIDPEIIQIRKQKLLRKAEKIAYSLREKFLGQRTTVLLEEREDAEWISGYTPHFLRVKIRSSSLQKNQMVSVFLQSNEVDGFIGVQV